MSFMELELGTTSASACLIIFPKWKAALDSCEPHYKIDNGESINIFGGSQTSIKGSCKFSEVSLVLAILIQDSDEKRCFILIRKFVLFNFVILFDKT